MCLDFGLGPDPACRLPILPAGRFWRVKHGSSYSSSYIHIYLMQEKTSLLFFDASYSLAYGLVPVKGSFGEPLPIDHIKLNIKEEAQRILERCNLVHAREAGLSALIGDYPPKKLV